LDITGLVILTILRHRNVICMSISFGNSSWNRR